MMRPKAKERFKIRLQIHGLEDPMNNRKQWEAAQEDWKKLIITNIRSETVIKGSGYVLQCSNVTCNVVLKLMTSNKWKCKCNRIQTGQN